MMNTITISKISEEIEYKNEAVLKMAALQRLILKIPIKAKILQFSFVQTGEIITHTCCRLIQGKPQDIEIQILKIIDDHLDFVEYSLYYIT